jgi:hypothetical protein
MENLWLKIKIWTKIVIVSVVVIYLLVFVLFNANKEISIWWWYNRTVDTTALMLIGCMFLAGVICTLLVRVTTSALRQVRELRERNKKARNERDMADMKAKVAMLQTKPAAAGEPSPPPPADAPRA